MDFAEALRLAMGEMTQQELEQLSGVDQALISRYLARKAYPGLRTLEKMERVLPSLRQLRSRRRSSDQGTDEILLPDRAKELASLKRRATDRLAPQA